ncbi:hypothetical protein PtA15_14A266 [Puccinia triticina]|uniref:Arrestin-like N-terminal domain-containing protein n=1 Tax=Puccinia triticina TaxID=208348 RepID=A0ABY7D2N9_9BASI|nr:uncharacterized protein PtA15_14A266 [Puccinia triticina]WAQ91383.1 hypothetical protein PtA15_14A266 [Puccinia triticina]
MSLHTISVDFEIAGRALCLKGQFAGLTYPSQTPVQALLLPPTSGDPGQAYWAELDVNRTSQKPDEEDYPLSITIASNEYMPSKLMPVIPKAELAKPFSKSQSTTLQSRI